MGCMEDRVVLVTGAGGGLGRAYAEAIAREGGSAIAFDIDAAGAAETANRIVTAGGRAIAADGSVADPVAVEAALDAGAREFGRIDGLVNNAGINYEAEPWEETPEQLRRIVDINVYGVLLCGILASRRMPAGSTIVNISSGAALGLRRDSSYAASKGAVASATYSWAIDMEERGIRVNALSPLAATGMVADMPIARAMVSTDADPQLITPVLLWLLSDLSEGVTGQFLRFNGKSLHVMGHPFPKAPNVERASWTVSDVADAMASPLRDRLEPYGLAPQLPPILR